MKVLCIESISGPFRATACVDSSLRLRNEPFFPPDDSPWHASLFIGARIDRLGMKISPRFATRYFSSVTLLAHPFVPGSEVPYEWSRDCALFNNGDIDISALPDEFGVAVSGSPGAPFGLTLGRDALVALLARAVSEISAFHTLKTGDIVALPLDFPLLPLPIGADYYISAAGTTLLHLKSR